MISPTLNVPQARFLSMPHKFKAYIAGFGSGKTLGWVWRHMQGDLGASRYKSGIFCANRHPQIRDIFYPTVEEVAADWGLNVKINEGNERGSLLLRTPVSGNHYLQIDGEATNDRRFQNW